MLNEAAKHLREGILLGRTDIIKKLLEEVRQTIKNEKEGKDKILKNALLGYSNHLNTEQLNTGLI